MSHTAASRCSIRSAATDAEALIISRANEKPASAGARVACPPADLVELAGDKWATLQFVRQAGSSAGPNSPPGQNRSSTVQVPTTTVTAAASRPHRDSSRRSVCASRHPHRLNTTPLLRMTPRRRSNSADQASRTGHRT